MDKYPHVDALAASTNYIDVNDEDKISVEKLDRIVSNVKEQLSSISNKFA